MLLLWEELVVVEAKGEWLSIVDYWGGWLAGGYVGGR